MSANLILACATIDERKRVDWQAAERRIAALSAQECLEDAELLHHFDPDLVACTEVSPDGEAPPAAPDIEMLRERLRSDLAEFRAGVEGERTDIDCLLVRGAKVWVTGGMSFGDEPSELTAPIHRLHLAGVLAAAGFDGEERAGPGGPSRPSVEAEVRPFAAILEEIAREALAGGDQAVLDLVEAGQELLEPIARPCEERVRAQHAALLELLAALIASRARVAEPTRARSTEAVLEALGRPEVDAAGALELCLSRLQERIAPADGPGEEAFESALVIWSRLDAGEVELEDLAREASRGDAICTYWQVRRTTLAYAPEAARSFFGAEEDEAAS